MPAIDRAVIVIYRLQRGDCAPNLGIRGWLGGLRDQRARERIAQRAVRLEAGLFGDAKSAGQGVMELRIDYGTGYRLYFIRRGTELVILLCGGEKSSQKQDIPIAKRMARDLKDQER